MSCWLWTSLSVLSINVNTLYQITVYASTVFTVQYYSFLFSDVSDWTGLSSLRRNQWKNKKPDTSTYTTDIHYSTSRSRTYTCICSLQYSVLIVHGQYLPAIQL